MVSSGSHGCLSLQVESNGEETHDILEGLYTPHLNLGDPRISSEKVEEEATERVVSGIRCDS